MTWHTYTVFLEPSRLALELVRADPLLGPSAYWIRDLSSFPWFDPSVRHGLPPNGLLAIRPVGPSGGEVYAYASPLISWDSFSCSEPRLSFQPPDDLDGYPSPPTPFLQYLKLLSQQTNSVVAYYMCGIFGGAPEFEYGHIFSDQETTYTGIFTPTPPAVLIERRIGHDPTQLTADVLIEVLKHLGLSLPTPYFAPHTGSFRWERHYLGHTPRGAA
jgi:hypothetical protein